MALVGSRDLKTIVVESKLFDEEYYLASNPDVAAAEVDPFEHYRTSGAMEGRNPNPLFSSRHFIDYCPDDRSSEDPLSSFLILAGAGTTDGMSNVASALANDSIAFVSLVFGLSQEQVDFVLQTGLFDAKFYHERNPDISDVYQSHELFHFLVYGENESRLPNQSYDHDAVALYVGEEDATSVFIQYVKLLCEQGVEDREHFRNDKSKFQLSEQAWVTPTSLHLGYLDGPFFSESRYGGRPLVGKTIVLPQTGNGALVIPIAPEAHCLSEVVARFVLAEPAYVSLSVHAQLDDPPLDQTSAEVLPHKPAKFYFQELLLEVGSRVFLKMSTNSESEVAIECLEFAPEYFVNRSIVARGFRLNSALPPAFDQSIHNKILVFGERPDGYLAYFREQIEEAGHDIEQAAWKWTTEQLSKKMRHACLIVFVDVVRSHNRKISLETVIEAANSAGIPTAFIDTSLVNHTAGASREAISRNRRLCDFALSVSKSSEINGRIVRAVVEIESNHWKAPVLAQPDWIAIRNFNLEKRKLPDVVVVTVLYKKAEQIASFIQVIERQNYPGKITLSIVDDCSPDDSFEIAKRTIDRLENHLPPRMRIELCKNQENLGNCRSRNRAIEETDGDLYIIVDSDCLLNRSFIREHVRAHLEEDIDVTVGPLNLETQDREAWQLLGELEKNPELVAKETNMQDSMQLDALTNCITRNLSISKRLVKKIGGFDPQFSYSANPQSGFGWEDVEFGARIYASGARIVYTEKAFSLHQSHDSSVPEERQIVGSARNFGKLFAKHPELQLVCRRWASDTASKIQEWAQSIDVQCEELVSLNQRFESSIRELAPLIKTDRRRLRIASYRWHAPHQYEIYKLGHQFDLVRDTGTGFTNQWPVDQRPLRDNVRFIDRADFNPSEYDLAILHFDENALCSDLSNGTLSADWGDSFRWFLDEIDLPKIAVCHGTPPFIGQYGANPDEILQFRVMNDEVERLRRAVSDVEVVCNSHQAQREWEFHRSRVIWHGLDPQEFPMGISRDKDVVTHGIDNYRPHYRGKHILARVIEGLGGEFGISTHAHDGPKLMVPNNPKYAAASFRAWINHLRAHKVYLNTTLRSPMPRSRTEAMMCGTIPISLRNHDVDLFVTHGVDGFYADSSEELAEYVRYVCVNEPVRERISKLARRTAIDRFNHDRFLLEWINLIESVV